MTNNDDALEADFMDPPTDKAGRPLTERCEHCGKPCGECKYPHAHANDGTEEAWEERWQMREDAKQRADEIRYGI